MYAQFSDEFKVALYWTIYLKKLGRSNLLHHDMKYRSHDIKKTKLVSSEQVKIQSHSNSDPSRCMEASHWANCCTKQPKKQLLEIWAKRNLVNSSSCRCSDKWTVRTLPVSGSSIICGLILVDDTQRCCAWNIVGMLAITNMLVVIIFKILANKFSWCSYVSQTFSLPSFFLDTKTVV
jgi:hypothetical protein